MLDTDFIRWIKPYCRKIYACNKNMGLETFSTKRIGHHGIRRPDFLIQTFSNKWICVEFEPGETYGEITSGATQLNDFYYLIKEKQISYFVGNYEIIPNLYLLATSYSKDGYLYKNDKRIIQTSGYSENEILNENNNTIFHATRWIWRFCGRDIIKLTNTNPIGVSLFSVLYANYYKKPIFELYGKYKYELEKW